MSSKKEAHELLKRAEAAGASVRHTRGGHWRVAIPGGGIVFMSDSPSDRRAIHQMRMFLKKGGLKL